MRYWMVVVFVVVWCLGFTGTLRGSAQQGVSDVHSSPPQATSTAPETQDTKDVQDSTAHEHTSLAEAKQLSSIVDVFRDKKLYNFNYSMARDVRHCAQYKWPNYGSNYTEPMKYAANCTWLLMRHEDLGQKQEKRTEVSEIATFMRATTADGYDIEIPRTPHTAHVFAADKTRGGTLAEVFDQKEIVWKQKFRGCRTCGYSCAGFTNSPKSRKEVFTYPILKKKRVQVKVMTSPERLVSDHPRSLFRLFVYGADKNLQAALTAHYMGWGTSISRGRLVRQACLKYVENPTFFFRRRTTVYSRTNIAHWLHDTLFPMFMTVYNHVGDPHSAKGKYNVVPDEGDSMTGLWREFWAVGEIGDVLLSTLFPYRSRVKLELGLCFKEAIFDCPKADSMGPIAPLQRWLTQAKSLSFVPLSVSSKLSLVMIVRCKGGSRFLGSWEEMKQTALGLGYGVTIPPPVPVFMQMTSLLKQLQRAHVLASVHGSELAPMLFMPNGSVVVEIVPREYKWHDAWYIRQAAVTGLHLLRVTPNKTAVKYHWHGESTEKVCGRSFLKHERELAKNGKDEASYRQLASTITVSKSAWTNVLLLSKELLFKQALFDSWALPRLT